MSRDKGLKIKLHGQNILSTQKINHFSLHEKKKRHFPCWAQNVTNQYPFFLELIVKPLRGSPYKARKHVRGG